MTIPNILIESSQSVQAQQIQQLEQQQKEIWQAQQEVSNDMNLGLTFFVLFFASIDIVVVIFDHSEDENRKAQYEKSKTEENDRDDTEPISYVV